MVVVVQEGIGIVVEVEVQVLLVVVGNECW